MVKEELNTSREEMILALAEAGRSSKSAASEKEGMIDARTQRDGDTNVKFPKDKETGTQIQVYHSNSGCSYFILYHSLSVFCMGGSYPRWN